MSVSRTCWICMIPIGRHGSTCHTIGQHWRSSKDIGKGIITSKRGGWGHHGRRLDEHRILGVGEVRGGGGRGLQENLLLLLEWL